MYLTRFPVNVSRRDSRKLLGSPQAMHAAVMASYPQAPDPTPNARVLWRVDHTENQSILYITGPVEPDLTGLKEQAGWPTLEGGWDTVDYRRFLATLSAGQTWAFRLTANPVRFARPRDGLPTQALGHVTVAQQQEWLLSRAPGKGVKIDEGTLAVQDRRTAVFKRRGTDVTLRMATFDGLLEITDAESARRALCAGIGRARAYGCGLMTLTAVS
ncbi:CRISPR system Cascade subunit CasE [Stackebrandtia endophytica]|uniref:CRISPR system Cascade subunit CasE n=1 Tax=Stackebrandtia endophytica TaxID=1496996 RepID=A0A543AZB0_9ACTN|nr:type I-E CRISPR-associated protein Cas6/Cse3/CasE [Stackebrandtia endophytica]TQL77908.1 CRISPR system Cascade subunit CasE [Stackebrandtia endophytica]